MDEQAKHQTGNMDTKMESNTNEEWNKQWQKLDKSLFGQICSLHRKLFISRFVAHLAEKYFPKQGIFVEAGCGTCESSARIREYERKLIPLDYSEYILKADLPSKYSKPIVADIREMPFEDDSIDGIWNLGVMEHFTERDMIVALNEFYRVLKNGSYAILLIPPIFGSSEIFLGTIERMINMMRKDKFHFMTEEITPVRSRKHITGIISKSKLQVYKTHFSPRDLFTYYAVICKKPS